IARAADGLIAAQHTVPYPHGVIDQTLPTSGERLPPDYALQHPQDWLDSAASACTTAIQSAGIQAHDVLGIGVAFTSCTMLPCDAHGTPLSLDEQWNREPLAWPKIWKHHGAKTQADRINQIAIERKEPWLARYGGVIGLEWFFPKVLETAELAPK